MIKTIQRRLDAILHWNISFVSNLARRLCNTFPCRSATHRRTLMEMASNVRFMEWEELGLRLLAMVIFACGVIASYMLTNYTNLHMRKLAIWVAFTSYFCCQVLYSYKSISPEKTSVAGPVIKT